MKKNGRYDISGLAEAQFEPGSRGRVVKNLMGIKRKRDMDEAESVALKTALDSFWRIYSENYRFKEMDIKMMHSIWLGGIYEWAGEYRQINMTKGNFSFAAAKQIPLLMHEFERGPLRRHTPCNFKSLNRVAHALAEVHVELILIHPFREGNGRLARVLSTLMASQAGLPILDFTGITGIKKEEYFFAVRSGLDRNYEPMEKIFEMLMKKNLSG